MAEWRVATLLSSEMTAKNVKALRFSIEGWEPHRAGQHYDVRLTAEDGYQAERSYSIASAPEETGIVELGVELLENGEVSSYLFGLEPGDQIEMRGPIGGHFVWDVTMPGPLCLIGGGSGMVPLMAMLRHRERHLEEVGGNNPDGSPRIEKNRPVIFLASIRSQDGLLYYDELRKISAADPGFTLVLTFTEMAPPDWDGYRRRIDEEMLTTVFGKTIGAMPMTYICGPTPFVEAAADILVKIGMNPSEIRTERFGGK
jgi:ferredoxin-NADP reductase